MRRNNSTTFVEKHFKLIKYLSDGRKHSTRDIQEKLNCDKKSVRAYIDNLTSQEIGFDIEEETKANKNVYWLRKKEPTFFHELKKHQIMVIQMIKTFSESLLGDDQLNTANDFLNQCVSESKNIDRLSELEVFNAAPFGMVNYKPHQETIKKLITAITSEKKCTLLYLKKTNSSTPIEQEIYINPLVLFSYKQTLYLWATKPDSTSLALPVHRIKTVRLSEKPCVTPTDTNFEKEFKKSFGLFRAKKIAVEIEFTEWAATYVSERQWAPDQKIKYHNNDTITISLSSSSKEELIGWILSFRSYAKVLKPESFVDEIKSQIEDLRNIYY